MENRLYPMREMLAELLMESGQAAAALQEYERALKAYPNRYRGYWGAALAARAAGQSEKAAEFIGKFVALTKNADPSRPEIALAKAQLAQR
jgi:tetratricopeptide (TPR) repeat protein